MITLDTTVVNVALPVIQRELHFSQSSLAWVVNAYLLTFGGLLLLAGRLGDLIGRKHVFLVGLGAFALSSLLCGLAPTAGVLVAARFFQGVSAAMVASMVLGIISPMFSERRERAMALSVFAFVAIGGLSLGLVLGGIVTDLLNWHWIFFINVPIGLGVLILGRRLLANHPGLGIREGADVLGTLLVTTAPMLAVYGVINAGSSNWSSVSTLAPLAGSLFLGGAFIAVEAWARTPLIPLRIFRHRNLVAATILRTVFQPGGFGFIFLGVLYLEHVLGYSPLRTGLAFLPYTGIMGFVSLGLIPRLVRLVDLKTLVVSGLVLITAGLLALDRISVHTGFVAGILPTMLLMGTGFGLCFMPSVSIAMSDVAESDSGVASGLTNVAVQLGGSLGIATLATISASRTTHLLADHEAIRFALTGGYRIGFLVAAGCTTTSLVIAIFLLRSHRANPVAEMAVEGSAVLH
jgi:EmrB/QacA subfamily drug resistance transporter